MGMDLRGCGGAFRFNCTGWHEMLSLAYDNGWEPRGTQAPVFYDMNGEIDTEMTGDPADWCGTYFSNNYQLVTDEDAANLASALESALWKIDDPKWKEYVRKFIDYCRAGNFAIG